LGRPAPCCSSSSECLRSLRDRNVRAVVLFLRLPGGPCLLLSTCCRLLWSAAAAYRGLLPVVACCHPRCLQCGAAAGCCSRLPQPRLCLHRVRECAGGSVLCSLCCSPRLSWVRARFPEYCRRVWRASEFIFATGCMCHRGVMYHAPLPSCALVCGVRQVSLKKMPGSWWTPTKSAAFPLGMC
jgi:hypothetical protein